MGIARKIELYNQAYQLAREFISKIGYLNGSSCRRARTTRSPSRPARFARCRFSAAASAVRSPLSRPYCGGTTRPGSLRRPFLASARCAEFDTSFYFVQTLELAAGAANITLLGLNLRDGLRMTGWICRKPA
jgi:hypothetical protein